MTIAICAIFKDEARYIEEWLAYHLSIGFDHFYLYDNASSDGTADLLAALPLSRSITVIDWPERPGQLSAYDHFCNTFAKKHQWVAFIDIDEFLFILGGGSAKDFTTKFEGFATILIHWLSFGSSGFGGRPSGLVIEKYIKRSPETNSNNLHVKSIVRSDCLLGAGSNPHVLRVRGPACDAEGAERANEAIQLTVCHTNAVICHYVTKSYEDWLQKLRRGKATSDQADDAYPSELFFQYDDPATVTDTRMRRLSSITQRTIDGWRADWRRFNEDLLVYKGGRAYLLRESIGARHKWTGLLPPNDSQKHGSVLEGREGNVSHFASGLEAQLEIERYITATSKYTLEASPLSGRNADRRSRPAGKFVDRSNPRIAPRCVFHNKSQAHWGGLMMRYMAALQLKRGVPGIELSNFDMPQWEIVCPALSKASAVSVYDAISDQHIDFQRIAYLVRDGLADWINWSGRGQRMEYFPAREICQKIYSTDKSDSLGLSFSHRHLVCPIRAGEVLDARHPGYTLIPAAFYKEIADQASLTPVFIGQTDDNAYMRTLREALPDAIYLPSQGPMWDFQTIRKSQNIVVSVSAFAWLAAWLSNAEHIYMPVYGHFNPRQYPYHDLLPLTDERYQFYEFPVWHAVQVDRVQEDHRQLNGRWEFRNARYFARL